MENKNKLVEFLEFAINTKRISADFFGLAGCTMDDDSYEKIAEDFIKQYKEGK